jgi:hypothetical protein
MCIQFAELAQGIAEEIAQAGRGAAIDYGALEQRIANALGEVVPARRNSTRTNVSRP